MRSWLGELTNTVSPAIATAEPKLLSGGRPWAAKVACNDIQLEAAKTAGFECAKMGRAELKGKDEPIDLYAVAWSQAATQQLVEQIQAEYEKKFKDLKKQQQQTEEARDKTLANAGTSQQRASDELQKVLDKMGSVGGLQPMIDRPLRDAIDHGKERR